jgi:hypothetical protein
MEQEIIEGEARALAVVEPPAKVNSLAMLDAATPEEYMERISRVCKILVDVVEKQKLSKKLGRGDKKHVELEAWQFLGSMPWIRCSAVIDWTKEIGDGLGWEARALVYRDGVVVGAGDGMCLRSESNWKAPKDYFALRSMAQSRAMSRALQGPLRFIFVLAGYAGAGAEEMPPDAITEAQTFVDRKVAVPQQPAEEADTPANRERGMKAVHALAREHKIDLDAPDSLYRKILLLDPAFAHHFMDAEAEVSSKALTYPELRRFYAALKAAIKERDAA